MKSPPLRREPSEDHILDIAFKMQKAKLPAPFIMDVVNLARQDESIVGLMELWADELEEAEREEIIADLQEHIEDDKTLPPRGAGPELKPKIDFEALDKVAGDIAVFKKRLKDIIDRNGGVSEVARKVGVPQPSLSRLLNSPSMPRHTTLYKIANALGLQETEIASEWSR